MKAQPLDQIMKGAAEMFVGVLKMDQMKMVSDQKGPDDLKAFVYNEEKTLKWLKKKFEAIKKSLADQRIVTSGATSLNYVKSSTESETTDEDAVAEAALGIISEYISLDLIEKLDNFYGISEKSKEPIVNKRKSEANGKEGDKKRIKIEEQENLPEESPPNAPKPQPPKATTKTKALEKAAKGSKSISSFFTKK
jgi:ribonuclease H2 subunit B